MYLFVWFLVYALLKNVSPHCTTLNANDKECKRRIKGNNKLAVKQDTSAGAQRSYLISVCIYPL